MNMDKPKRIQLSRKAGWRMPPNTIKVTRGPGMKWGNPFRVFGRDEYLFCDASHRRTILTPWVIFDHEQDIVLNPASAAMAVAFFQRWLDGEFNDPKHPIVRPCLITLDDIYSLRGKNLACWCKLCAKHANGLPLGEECSECAPCHVNVLLPLANA